MSLILDALRKAERERNLGQAPQLNDVTASTPPPSEDPEPPRNSWSWMTLAIAGLLLLSLFLFLFLRRPTPEPSQPSPTPALPTVQNTPAPPAPPPMPRVAEAPPPVARRPAPPPVEDAIGDDVDAATLDDLMAPPPEPPPPPVVAPTRPAVARTPTPPPRPSQPSIAGSDGRIATLKLEPPPTTNVPRLNELPPSVRGDFPSVSYDVHVWNENPSRRFVLIGGKRYNQGDRLPGGPVLKEIVPDGVVFDHHGSEVLVPVNR